MRIDREFQKAYNLHSSYLSRNDNKKREYYFEIENLEEDYKETKRTLKKYSDVHFDFVASCLKSNSPVLRIFSKDITGRFGVSKKISLQTLKDKLIRDGYIFAERSTKSGPLCLNEDFSEPFSAKWFRFTLPWWEFKNGPLFNFIQKIKNFIKS